MFRRGVWTLVISTVLFVVAAVGVSADSAPQPAVTGGVNPVSASAGSSAQQNGTANVSSGRASSKADGSGAEGLSCGARAGTAGANYGAQPTKVSTAGTSSPAGCASTGAGGQGAGGKVQTQLAGSTTTGAKSGGAEGIASALGLDRVANTADAARNGPWVWLALAILLGFLLFLLGVAIAPKRRQARATE